MNERLHTPEVVRSNDLVVLDGKPMDVHGARDLAQRITNTCLDIEAREADAGRNIPADAGTIRSDR